METQRITIIVKTDADPSELLDLATEFGQSLADDHMGVFDEAEGASVGYAEEGATA